MKVKKIQILEELMDIPDDRRTISFAIIPPMAAQIFREGEIPDFEITGKKVEYEVRKVALNPDEFQAFLVRIDDRKIFDELVLITEKTLERAVSERTGALEEQANYARRQAIEDISEAHWRVAARIRALPWYKRLFKKF